jgi:hypothetical protein
MVIFEDENDESMYEIHAETENNIEAIDNVLDLFLALAKSGTIDYV